MVSPKKAWREPRFSMGNFVEPLPDVRQRFGEAIGELVEMYADMARAQRDGPSRQDVRHTLEAIARAPDQADLTRLDSHTHCLLSLAAWCAFGQLSLRALDGAEAAHCARLALDNWQRDLGGRPAKDARSVALLRQLIDVSAGWPEPERRQLYSAALNALGVVGSNDGKNLDRLLALARQTE